MMPSSQHSPIPEQHPGYPATDHERDSQTICGTLMELDDAVTIAPDLTVQGLCRSVAAVNAAAHGRRPCSGAPSVSRGRSWQRQHHRPMTLDTPIAGSWENATAVALRVNEGYATSNPADQGRCSLTTAAPGAGMLGTESRLRVLPNERSEVYNSTTGCWRGVYALWGDPARRS